MKKHVVTYTRFVSKGQREEIFEGCLKGFCTDFEETSEGLSEGNFERGFQELRRRKGLEKFEKEFRTSFSKNFEGERHQRF